MVKLRGRVDLKILGQIIPITEDKNNIGRHTVGEAHYSTGEISVSPVIEGVFKDITILHEVIHHLDVLLGIDLAESQICALASGIHCVLRDNSIDFKERMFDKYVVDEKIIDENIVDEDIVDGGRNG